MKAARPHPRSAAFLLAQVGAHAAAEFATRLEGLELTPGHAGLLRAVANAPGLSQQALAGHLRLVPSRLVVLLDQLEARALVERRNHPEDRRLYALHLTSQGQDMLGKIAIIARAHDEATSRALTAAERETLHALLVKIAEQQGLTPGVHPGFARMTEHETSRGKKKTRG